MLCVMSLYNTTVAINRWLFLAIILYKSCTFPLIYRYIHFLLTLSLWLLFSPVSPRLINKRKAFSQTCEENTPLYLYSPSPHKKGRATQREWQTAHNEDYHLFVSSYKLYRLNMVEKENFRVVQLKKLQKRVNNLYIQQFQRVNSLPLQTVL